MKIIAINGSYVKGGVTDQVIAEFKTLFSKSDISFAEYKLREEHIEFCANCRNCTQSKSDGRGKCLIDDNMSKILDELDDSDILILASPVNFFDITAVMKRWFERLVCYAYWPWNKPGPEYRIKTPNKKGILVVSSAMPKIFVGWFTNAIKSMKLICKTVGAKPIKTIKLGMKGLEPKPGLSESEKKMIRECANRIVSESERRGK